MNNFKDVLTFIKQVEKECDKQKSCPDCPKYLSKVCDNIGYNPRGAYAALKYLSECDLTLKK